MRLPRICGWLLAAVVAASATGFASDWPGFRGPSGTGVSDDDGIPSEWSGSQRLLWRVPLPGPGSSCPIVVGDKVFVTSFSGYGTGGAGGSQENLVRHLVCLSLTDGKILWEKAVKAKLPEDRAGGMLSEHGYASHTPVCDGERVYVFFGKTGILAFDMEGQQLWQADVGSGSGAMNWGSATSLVLYKNLVIANADAESECIVALDKSNGKQVWKASSTGYKGTWSTPVLVDVGQGDAKEQELVVNVPGEIWALNPDTGALKWFCETGNNGTPCTSVVAKDGIVYSVLGGPRGSATLAVRAGGKNDVTKSHVIWRKAVGCYVPSPVLVGDYLYFVNDGTFQCHKISDGEQVYRERLGGGRNGFYASLAAADDKLYVVSRRSGTYVVEAGEKFKELSKNEIEGDSTDFNASPAFKDGKLLLRSNKALYCIGEK